MLPRAQSAGTQSACSLDTARALLAFTFAGFEEQLEALGREVAAQAAAYDATEEGIAE